MKTNEKISALINAYIELAQNHHYNDSQIIDSLSDIFDENELVELGFGDFVHSYFHDSEEIESRKDEAISDDKNLEPGMTGTIKMDQGIKRSLWGKSFEITIVKEGYAVCTIDGLQGSYAIPNMFMEKLSSLEKTTEKASLSSQIQSAERTADAQYMGFTPCKDQSPNR